MNRARIIAFYLPQFHPFKENDEWWGKGFTEWTNVGKAKPLFKGHYQPRVPADLGYYDLRLSIIREQQAAMAKEAGVEGFMYWHYWFGNGKTLMANIFDEVLTTGKPDFPFCLGWANHSWTRRTWNCSAQYQQDMDLIKQEYPGEEDHINHFYNILPAFLDKRYITVDDKPIFIIWSPLDIPNVSGFIKLWNDLAHQNGLKGIHFVGIWTTGTNPDEIETKELLFKLGFDALTLSSLAMAQKQSIGRIKNRLIIELNKRFPRYAPLMKYKYSDIINNFYSEFDSQENIYPTIIPNWDRSPRGGRRAVIYTGSTPELFGKMTAMALDKIKNKQDEHKIIFLRSWNEWAEGNYMEPDLRFGLGYVNMLKKMIVK
ncbi:MAG: glycoside hydrolase family 99-like domain-containing protein [Bacteroidetes bacterium]|uniref:Glycoside hydrolase family 99-like domain-containing protein n=1 Tax=Candidatus Cryptobacteroides excrementipullorum TaxID=2840761 RepID=A0A9D9ITA1_9BACT|nr:glycoside hydrolase family 99-like domain-containing protein [Candidatus Cryptobacteroides excrementipullorum]